MSADQAFGNLLSGKVLAGLPAAAAAMAATAASGGAVGREEPRRLDNPETPSRDHNATTRRNEAATPYDSGAERSRPGVIGGAAGGATLDADDSIYSEARLRSPGAPSSSTTRAEPSDTELLAAPGLDEIEDARLGGARIISQNTGDPDVFDIESSKATLLLNRLPSSRMTAPASHPPQASALERPALSTPSRVRLDARLSHARKVRRFAYIPLTGLESFEAAARDFTAGMAAKDYGRPSLAVTGTVRGEGRTELAIRLALALGKRVGRRILLADFDVRKPEVAMRLGLSSRHFTVSDVLRGACRLEDALTLSEEDNLYILAAHPPERDGDEVIDGRQAEMLISELHSAFDFIIIDCGPIRQADAIIACRLAGGAVLTARCGFSRSDELEAAGRELAASGIRLAGLALIGA